jgi:hypothetical protein
MSSVGSTSSDARCVIVPERLGHGHDVVRHGALRVGVAGVRRLVAVAVAAQVGTDDGVVAREVGGHVPPHQVGLREAVQEHDRRPGAPDGHVE